MDKETEINPKARIWLEKKEKPILGEGRAELLASIEEEGSLNKAAESMGMSYRHAWGVIKKIEERSGFKIVSSEKGGKGGGGTNLTEKGQELLNRYKWMDEALEKMVEKKTLWENMSTKLSARNRLKGKIEDIELGEVGAKIKIEVEPDTLTAYITREAAEDLDLEEGDNAEAVIKATEVMVSKP
ncbi:hypothetical protein AKJ65_04365 [candidate division MSBL1 archaeon SCGC-AAA259E19]|uniref:Mop domain-containing protein n=1 Tax=candidate division MSBL1 archaeon SCGC-AAA259E19 TaxID=1698264 RepID=A0A133UJS9_9EURY|nr:hypothetical protein AKJ65_04365 [candidate division MSBL1 archaeon SCGC-AAA259E19]